MKIKALAALCSKIKQIVLYDDGALTAIFDIPTDKAADMLIRNIPMPAPYDTGDDGEDEEELRFDLASSITYNGTEFLPLMTPDGRIYFIKAKYLRPIVDCEGLRLSLRHMHGDGQAYITAKDGMFLTAIIMPIAPKDYMSEWLGDIYNGAAKARSYEGRGNGDEKQL